MTALAPFTAQAVVTRGTFTAEVLADGNTPAEAFETVNQLLKKMKLKAPRGKKYRHLAPVVKINLHSRVDVLDNAAELQAEYAAHVEELRTYAHGLHYPIMEGTPELFGEAEPVTDEAKVEEVKAEPVAPQKRRKERKHNPRINYTTHVYAAGDWRL